MVWMIVSELLLLGASILVFRSAWILLDQHFESSSLWLMLITGIIVSTVALLMLNHKVEREENVWPMVAAGKSLHEMDGLDIFESMA